MLPCYCKHSISYLELSLLILLVNCISFLTKESICILIGISLPIGLSFLPAQSFVTPENFCRYSRNCFRCLAENSVFSPSDQNIPKEFIFYQFPMSTLCTINRFFMKNFGHFKLSLKLKLSTVLYLATVFENNCYKSFNKMF